jgi:hypothetical protein
MLNVQINGHKIIGQIVRTHIQDWKINDNYARKTRQRKI